MGQLSGGQDGNSVVGSAEVGHAHQSSDGELCASLPTDMAGQLLDDEVDAALLTYQFQHASCHHRHNNQLTHRENAFPHRSKPAVDIEGTCQEADDSREYQSQHEYAHNVHAEGGGDEYGEVGDDLHPFHVAHLLRHAQPAAHEQIDRQNDGGGGHYDEEVDAELVGQAATLRLRGHDGGVGDKREVVAKERAAHDDGCH